MAAQYKNGFLDMKAGFHLTNPHITGVDWSFAPEPSKETVAEDEGAPRVEEGEVTGDTMEIEDVIVLNEPEQPPAADAAAADTATAAEQPPTEQATTGRAFLPDPDV